MVDIVIKDNYIPKGNFLDIAILASISLSLFLSLSLSLSLSFSLSLFLSLSFSLSLYLSLTVGFMLNFEGFWPFLKIFSYFLSNCFKMNV